MLEAGVETRPASANVRCGVRSHSSRSAITHTLRGNQAGRAGRAHAQCRRVGALGAWTSPLRIDIDAPGLAAGGAANRGDGNESNR